MVVNSENAKIYIGNKNKLGVFDGLPVEPIRSEECVQNLANCLGIERGMLVPDKNGKLKILIKGWVKK